MVQTKEGSMMSCSGVGGGGVHDRAPAREGMMGGSVLQGRENILGERK